jgi:large subunit ribosomal protein L14e
MIFEKGRVCVKIAGRDAGRKCVVVENHGNFVTVDGDVRRKKVNVKHLEPLAKTIDVSGGAKKAFEKEGWVVWDHKARKATERPKKQKKKSTKPVKEKKTKKAESVEDKLEPKVEPVKEAKPVKAKVEEPKAEVKEPVVKAEKPVEEAKPEAKE